MSEVAHLKLKSDSRWYSYSCLIRVTAIAYHTTSNLSSSRFLSESNRRYTQIWLYLSLFIPTTQSKHTANTTLSLPPVTIYIYIPRSIAAKFLRSLALEVESVRISSPLLISLIAQQYRCEVLLSGNTLPSSSEVKFEFSMAEAEVLINGQHNQIIMGPFCSSRCRCVQVHSVILQAAFKQKNLGMVWRFVDSILGRFAAFLLRF